MAAWRDDGLPRTAVGGPLRDQAEGGFAILVLGFAGLLLGAGDGERERLEHPDTDAVARWLRAVLTSAAGTIHQPRRQVETGALEFAINEDGDPPTGDVVLAKLEEPTRHQVRPSTLRRRASSLERRPRR